jgi:hypothetical protein
VGQGLLAHVQVEDADTDTLVQQSGHEVDGEGGLSRAALLVSHDDDVSHQISPLEPVSFRWNV